MKIFNKNINQGNVIVWRTAGSVEASFNIELIIAKALTLRGTKVLVVICDGLLSGCINRCILDHKPIDKWPEMCLKCYQKGVKAINFFGLPHRKMSDWINNEKRDKLSSIADQLNYEDIVSEYFNEIPIGQHALSSTIRYFKGYSPPKDYFDRILREYCYSSLITSEVIKGIIENINPSQILTQHTSYVDWAPVIDYCLNRRIPITCWKRGFLKNNIFLKTTFYLSNQRDFYDPSHPEKDGRLNQQLSIDENKRLNAYMSDRAEGSRNKERLFTKSIDETNDLRKILNLPDDKLVWGVFTHVNWDALFTTTKASDSFFNDATRWAIETIKQGSKIPEIIWVIKIHPGEKIFGSAYGIKQAVLDQFSTLPSNIRLITPESDINTYALLSIMDGGVTIHGTVGLEIAMCGLPVIINGQAFYSGHGFTYDSQNNEHYFELLKQAPFLKPLTDKQIQKARSYCYDYFIDRQLPFIEFVLKEGKQLNFKTFSDLEEGKSEILDMICDSLLNGGEFIVKDKLRKRNAEKICDQGKQYFINNDMQLAKKYFETALEIDPLYTIAYNNLGKICLQNKKINKAIEYFEKAFTLSPYEKETILNFGSLMSDMNKKEDAIRLYSFYLKKFPEDKKVCFRLQNLKNSGIVLVLFRDSFGEVDWILPVLHKLKQFKPEWRIIAVFSPLWRKYHKVILTNRTLESELQRVADKIIFYNNKEKFYSEIKNPEQVHIILKDYSPDRFPFRPDIEKMFPHAKVIAFPHGITMFYVQKRNNIRNCDGWGKMDVKTELILLNSELEARSCYQRFSDAKYSIVGIPFHDEWWIKKLTECKDFLESSEAKFASSASRVFTFFPNMASTVGSVPDDTFKYIFSSISEILLSNTNNVLLIKPHPRFRLSEMTSYLKDFDSSKYMITSLHAIQVLSLTDIVISFPSSVILDALRMKKPVIEFFPIVTNHERFPIDQSSILKTNTTLAGLSLLVRTKEDFANNIKKILSDNSNSILNSQLKAYKKYSNQGDASSHAANIILSLIELGTAKNVKLPYIFSEWSPVTHESNVFSHDTNTVKKNLSLNLKRFKAYNMPISSLLLRELAHFFNLDTFIATGTFYETMMSQACEIFREVHSIESAVDLYQPLKMPEITKHNNIHIYHSANILEMVLQRINGQMLLWLSVHESAAITNKSRTNSSIIEELKVVKKSKVKDAILLINNLRYFQPLIKQWPDHISSRKERHFPFLQEAVDIILEINPSYQFAVLGDIAIAYPEVFSVEISPSIRSCTLSRLFNENNLDIISVIEAEIFIAFGLSKLEKKAIRSIYNDYCDPYEEAGLGAHYRYWNGLTYFGEQRYDESCDEFYKTILLNFNHFRVGWFLIASAQRSGNNYMIEKAQKISLLNQPAVAKYYHFFNGLILFNENKYKEANQEFSNALRLNFIHNRIYWYISESTNRAEFNKKYI